MSDHIKHVSDASFDKDVLQSPTPVLVGLLGRVVRPLQDDRAGAGGYGEGIRGSADCRQARHRRQSRITSQFGIRGIPTLILFKGGKPHAQKVGALSKSQLAAFVDSNL